MKLYKAFFSSAFIRAVRTIGIPLNCECSKKRILLSIFTLALGILFFILSLHYVPESFKIYLPSLLIEKWLAIVIFTIGVGNLIGLLKFEYGEREEIMFMLSLPISRQFIVNWKITTQILEFCIIMLILLLFVVPWGSEAIKWEIFCVQWFVLFLLTIASLMWGMVVSALIAKKITNELLRKVVTYGLVLFFFVMSIIAVLHIDTSFIFKLYNNAWYWIATTNLLLVLVALSIKATCTYFSAFFEILNISNSRTETRNYGKNKWGSFMTATAKKDCLYYLREIDQLIHMLIIFVIIIISLSKFSWFEKYSILLILLCLPYSFSGIITLHLIGRDGVALNLIKMLRGTLKNYYLMRTVLSYIFVLIPTLISYIFLSILFYKEGFYIQNILLILLFSFIFVMLAMGISVLFLQKKNGNIYLQKRGVSVLGEIFYWVVGIVLPIALTRWANNGYKISNVPLGFIVIAIVTIVTIISIFIVGYLYIDKVND